MKWLIYCLDKDFHNLWHNYVLDYENLILHFSDRLPELKRIDIDTIIFCQDNDFLYQEAQKHNIFTVGIYREEKSRYKYDLFYHVCPLKNIIEKADSEKKISKYISFTYENEAWPFIIKNIQERKFGKYNLLSKEYNGQDVLNFYNIEAEIIDNKLPENSPEYKQKFNPPFVGKLEKKVNIYIPTYYRWEKTKKSLISILQIAGQSTHDVAIYVGDNNSKIPVMQAELKTLPKPVQMVFFSDINLGKAKMVNTLHRKARDCDYIFSIDSDMIAVSQQYNPLDRMIEYLEKCINVGLVSSQQKECCHHWFNRGVNIERERDFVYGFAPDHVGVAGGAICMRKQDWEDVGMYKENHDIYTGDDSILTYNVPRKLKKRVIIAMDTYFIHPNPSEDEKGYTEWKTESWKRDNFNFIKDDYKGSNTKGYYDE
jgi:hypothetical protein